MARVTDDLTGGGASLAGGGLSLTRVVLPYSTVIATPADTGNYFTITATDGVAFTISAPTSPKTGQQITYTIRNTSGGALGTITWNAVFKMPAFATPGTAGSRSVTFVYDGTNWIQLYQSATDVPN